MCGQAKAKYARKLRQFDSRAAAYDRSMNLVEGSRQCNCACIECSHVALKKYKKKHFRSNWAPVQPRYFQLRLKECKLEQSNTFKHLVQSENEQLDLMTSNTKLKMASSDNEPTDLMAT